MALNWKYTPTSPEILERKRNETFGERRGFFKEQYKVYQPKQGDITIRFLPATWKGEDAFYIMRVWVHYSVGPNSISVLCPLKMGRGKCPLCEERQKYDEDGDRDRAKKFVPQPRCIAWIRDPKNEDPNAGPELWSMSPTVFRQIMALTRDRETGDTYFLDDPENGYNLYGVMTMTKKPIDNTLRDVPTYDFSVARRPSSVSERDLEYVIRHPLPETLDYLNYSEIEALYKGEPLRRDELKSERTYDDDHRLENRRSYRDETSESVRANGNGHSDDGGEDEAPFNRSSSFDYESGKSSDSIKEKAALLRATFSQRPSKDV
jgi:hypothetical protein